jgi:hypothetical protein
MAVEGSGSLLSNAKLVYRDLFGGPIFSVGNDGQVYLQNILFPDGTVQATASAGNMLQVSNDNALVFPSPLLNQWSPTYEYYNFTSGSEQAQLTSNVLTVFMNHGWQVGESITFTNMQSTFGFLNNQSVVITGVTAPSSATITAVSQSGQTITVTANNTFNGLTGDVIKLSGLTTNTFANGCAVTVRSSNGTQFTFQWTDANHSWTNGAETGTATELLNSAFTANFTHADVGKAAIVGSAGTKVNPFLWAYDTFNQKWIDLAYIDSSVPTPGDPTVGAYSKLAFSRPIHLNDSKNQFNGIKQAGPLSIYHLVGNNENLFGPDYFDVAVGIATDMSATESRIFTNIHQIYTEHRISGAPILTPNATETAVTGARITVPDNHTNTWSAAYVAAVVGLWSHTSTTNTVPYGGGINCVGVLGQSNNNNPSTTMGFPNFIGVLGQATDSSGGAAQQIIGYGGYFQATGFHNLNVGVRIPNHPPGSGTGWNFLSDTSGANSGYVGIAGHLIMNANASGHSAIRTARFNDGAPGNTDVAGVLTFSAATTATYTFTEGYSAAPVIVISPVNPGTTTFTITSLTTTAFTVTASASFTGNVNYIMVGRN